MYVGSSNVYSNLTWNKNKLQCYTMFHSLYEHVCANKKSYYKSSHFDGLAKFHNI